uniref:Uncharacterized protein n=1 Tax=viral metagenome TaxID=1070528 RepID=A0A6M3IT57_9ZZZZ
MKYVFAALVLVLCGCIGTPKIRVNRSKEERPTGWIIDSQGVFHAGYGRHDREILIIVSPEGKKYLAITGCGVTEVFPGVDGKSTVEE